MAQAVVPAMQCQMGKPSVRARPTAAAAAGRVWGVRRTARGTYGFKVLALGPETTGVVQRMNQLLDMDTTPFTDEIIAEYIWVGGSGIGIRSKSRAFFDLENGNAELKSELKDLYINTAMQKDKDGDGDGYEPRRDNNAVEAGAIYVACLLCAVLQ